MKKLIKNLLPKPLLDCARYSANFIRTCVDFGADRRRFLRFGSSGDSTASWMTTRQIEAQLTKDYHRIEKGMALPEPKRPFGRDVQARLGALLAQQRPTPGDRPYLVAARRAHDAIGVWNGGGALDDAVAPSVDETPIPIVSDPASFFETRHSVRNFDPGVISAELLSQATRLAMSSPSVCNREPWLVRYYSGTDVARILAHQNGNRGFRSHVPTLALVSTDVALFGGSIERNQAWIEGGIFASTLVWALHALGLSTCMLNLSMTTSSANALRRAVNMPDQEIPIMMIAIGHAADGLRVARSSRRGLAEVIQHIPASTDLAT